MLNQEQPAELETPQLHERLNRIYKNLRNTEAREQKRQFEYLWDAKELALLERRRFVQIPATWLERLEQFACTEERKGA